MNTITVQPSNNLTMTDKQKPGAWNLLNCKCPRCREGDMFLDSNPWHLKNTMKMNNECPVCKQQLNIEVGFYYGSSYISYGLTIAISVATFIAWWLLVGISIHDNRVLYWLPFNAVLLLLIQPYLMRVSRTGWLAFFVPYNKHWKTTPPEPLERVNSKHESNW